MKISKTMQKVMMLSLIVLVSASAGVVIGVKASKNSSSIKNSDSLVDKVMSTLKDNWRSDIYYGEAADEDAIIAQFVSSIYNYDYSKQLDKYTYVYKYIPETPGTSPSGKMGITIQNMFDYPVVTYIQPGSASEGVIELNDIILGIGKKDETDSLVYHYICEEGYGYTNVLDYGKGNIGERRYIELARYNSNTSKFDILEKEIVLKNAGSTIYTYEEPCDIDDTLMVKLTKFTDLSSGDDTSGQLQQILEKNTKNNIIIDLRSNGGGDLSSLVKVCDLFLKKNQLVTTLEYKTGSVEKYTTSDTCYDFDHIFMLMNENTASASEVMIECFKHYFSDKLTLIGTTSYGKGIAQRTIALDSDYRLQYTAAKWYAPDGTNIHEVGIEPTSSDDKFTRTESYTKMLSYATSLYFDKNTNLVKDKVNNQIKYLADVLNTKYNYSIRTDGYFDSNYENTIKEYQTLKGVEASGVMNETTFLYLVKDFYEEQNSYDSLSTNRIKTILGA